ncbi:MAG: hypothetical protein MJ071_08065 [Oscillospiraceae bacterium]|nr:hypothetical protein [Oscillospiraceae bacterium]
MEKQRMSNADMLQYCEEALGWEDFGPIDILFFETVKRILKGELCAQEEEDYPETIFDDEGFFNETETSGDYYDPSGDVTFTI